MNDSQPQMRDAHSKNLPAGKTHGGVQHTIFSAPGKNPVGEVVVVATADGLVGVYFSGGKHVPDIAECGPRCELDDDAMQRDDVGTSEPSIRRILCQARAELSEYFVGKRKTFTVPLDWAHVAAESSEFSVQVWRLLQGIAYGATTTYGALAREMGSVGLSQRVGQVVGRNPWSVIVPCHRVLGADGSLTGYAGGLDRKRWLLQHEEPSAAEAGRLF
ncbi:methylated-DNA--[protein]-cysteine S-methyltransferase [Corynebacterium pseudodiphtheriticum]|uniref:methylated-DNA--[protein]-cysteine S-methyltransferase n=1 Tax=Corynebacterium pseudodiphtheriticum TaxID=37637 RepID=UPI002542F5FF|nr:methylated-DNA--[protein]-cysteine S-methyltransferase [Corynebacterium pseudodiphtheriticum]MDK4249221.1 methylated-DNA--[protein]-cysteine S-methyltransferase [Corynebacterium pseudodiphtheriticum]MDK4287794.1 methylated-DNA--[protein]-cysteine S-methyltransferase [Corynebacterium pseudodiphtheriticum]